MGDSPARRRGHGEDAIYFDETKNRYVGAVSLGSGPDGKRLRRKVTGRSKQEVRDKLKALHADLDRGLRTSATYTVDNALDDWLANGLSGRSDRTKALSKESVQPLRGQLGAIKLRVLTAADVQLALDELSARLATRTLQIAPNCLERAIRHAEVRDPVVLGVTTGMRIEELRALRWTEVDMDAGTVAVYRAVRVGTDTKTPKSRRVLSLPQVAMQALRDQLDRQARDRLRAGEVWEGHGLVFASSIGTPLDHHNVLRQFRRIAVAAGLGNDWVPKELRHTFVSLLSSNGTAIEDIADLVGRKGTATTQLVYRKVIVPELRRGAEVMDQICRARSSSPPSRPSAPGGLCEE